MKVNIYTYGALILYELSKISGCIQHNTGQITLNGPLSYNHLIYSFMESSDFQSAEPLEAAGSSSWWGDGGTIAPEVGLLSHNIVIQGIK